MKSANPARLACAALCVAISLGIAGGREARAGDAVAAEALFREARTLFDAGRTAEACEKFAESQRIDPSSGTLLNQARCEKHLGKTASAWAHFLAAARLARAQGFPEREEEAKKQATELESNLSYLTIASTQALAGLEVKRDDVVLYRGALNVKVPVDPGEHRIEATATGYQPWAVRVLVESGGDHETIVVPALEPRPTMPMTSSVESVRPVPPDVASKSFGPSPKKTLGMVLGGVGVVGLATGIVAGVLAFHKRDAVRELCNGDLACEDPRALDIAKSGQLWVSAANAAFAVGILGSGLGGYLMLSSDKAARSSQGGAQSGNTGGWVLSMSGHF